ncbi:MAG: hypothetical protein JWP52_3464 [Rhizobacter sp.]|jgi:hypothetical protein|nr:hypothetical protein [Rhizobacter sp.]
MGKYPPSEEALKLTGLSTRLIQPLIDKSPQHMSTLFSIATHQGLRASTLIGNLRDDNMRTELERRAEEVVSRPHATPEAFVVKQHTLALPIYHGCKMSLMDQYALSRIYSKTHYESATATIMLSTLPMQERFALVSAMDRARRNVEAIEEDKPLAQNGW